MEKELIGMFDEIRAIKPNVTTVSLHISQHLESPTHIHGAVHDTDGGFYPFEVWQELEAIIEKFKTN